MFSAVAHKNLADTKKYFDESLAQNDYYALVKSAPASGWARARIAWACQKRSRATSFMRSAKIKIPTMANG
jgi:hypothetical protein